MAAKANRSQTRNHPRPAARRTRRFTAVLLLGGTLQSVPGAPEAMVQVGSKSFTESYLLGETIAQVIDRTGEARAERKLGLGGTGITYRAITNGDIDIYPEYTGTIAQAILKDDSVRSIDEIRRRVQADGLVMSDSLGFDNTYALAVREAVAARFDLVRISDLRRHPEFTGAFSSGFLERNDGWPGLSRHYGLKLAQVRVIEHALAYEAVAQGKVEVIDIFSTDGKLARYELRVLRDDQGFFPDYHAVLLARRDFAERFPATWTALQEALVGKFDNVEMSRLNARADLDGQSLAEIAAAFLGQEPPDPQAANQLRRRVLLEEIFRLSFDHLYLVVVALFAAAGLGIPLGITAARFRRLGQFELMSIGMLQTIPALALLCFMIPFFGIGKLPALVALFIYALLPIVRNTYTGLIGLDQHLLEIASVLGLSAWQRLFRIELPLASLQILAGVKTSAVLTVGTATLAAFIGGGGYGTLIVRGLALDDLSTILAGAIPSAVMALAIHGLFEAADQFLIPQGLRKDYRGTSLEAAQPRPDHPQKPS